MLTLYQTEWCPYSHQVRQRLTELGIDYIVRQVAAQRDDRAELRQATCADRVPILVPDHGPLLEGADEILRYLSERFEEPPDAELHRAKARTQVPAFPELEQARLRSSRRGTACRGASASSLSR
jgi:glutathione S-transferase